MSEETKSPLEIQLDAENEKEGGALYVLPVFHDPAKPHLDLDGPVMKDILKANSDIDPATVRYIGSELRNVQGGGVRCMDAFVGKIAVKDTSQKELFEENEDQGYKIKRPVLNGKGIGD